MAKRDGEIAAAFRLAAEYLEYTPQDIQKMKISKEIVSSFLYAGATETELSALANMYFERRIEYFHRRVLQVLRGEMIFIDHALHEALQNRSEELSRLEKKHLSDEAHLSGHNRRGDILCESYAEHPCICARSCESFSTWQ